MPDPGDMRQWGDSLEPEQEAERVRRWRFQAARHVGLTKLEANLFADSDGNVALLRNAGEHGATHDQLAAIFL